MWYTASLLFKDSSQSNEVRETLWQESIRLVEAETLEQAYDRAEAMGVAAEEYNRSVLNGTWEYCCVGHIHALNSMTPCDGFEVFSLVMPDSAADEVLKTATDARVERKSPPATAANDDSAGSETDPLPPDKQH